VCYERGLSAVYFEEHDRVGQIEYISHSGLISKLYKRDPSQSPNEAQAKTYEKLDTDMIFWTLQYFDPYDQARKRGEQFSIRADSWSELFPTTWRATFRVSSVEDVLNYEPEEVDLGDHIFNRVVEYFDREHRKTQRLYRSQLVPS